VYAPCILTPFRLWNEVSVCSNSTSGFAAMSYLTVQNVVHVAQGQMLLSLRAACFWIWNDVFITETCYVITILPILGRHLDIRHNMVSTSI